MPFRGDMTFRAGQRDMMGNRFFRGNFPVAGAAFLRGMGQQRIVGIMTFHTDFARVMQKIQDLRKSGRARRVVLVAQKALIAIPRDVGSEFIGRLDMFRGRSVAHLA